MNHTVLLIEDEEELRDSMREALELKGYTVVAARDGHEALEQLDRLENICVVLLDLIMPRVDGWAFFAKMRERESHAAVPVIVHSSAPKKAPAGVARVLAKPLMFDQLLSTVQEFCRA
jgi:CheY-like chemotaxis protein